MEVIPLHELRLLSGMGSDVCDLNLCTGPDQIVSGHPLTLHQTAVPDRASYSLTSLAGSLQRTLE